MNSPCESEPRPSTVEQRVAARLLDLLRMGIALALGLVPAACVEVGVQSMGSPSWEFRLTRVDWLESLPLIVFGVVVALGYELVRLARKGKTAGKASLRLELRSASEPGLAASRKRAVSRYLVSVGACVAAAGSAFAVAGVLGIVWSPGRVVVLAVVPCVAAWASCLLTALMRADRRGWHDLAAGTVLVSHHVPPPRGRQLKRTETDEHPRDRRHRPAPATEASRGWCVPERERLAGESGNRPVIASGKRPEFVPAAMIDRVVARGLDLLAMSTVFVLFALVSPLLVAATGAIGLGSMLRPGRDPDGVFAALILGGLAAACWEPARQMLKGRTFGRATVGIDLRDAANPEPRASTVRMLARYTVSVGACGVSIGLAFTVVLVVGMSLTPWRVIGLIAMPSVATWASALLSALFRADRRGWHDLMAGTMLVSRSTLPLRRDNRNQRWDPRDGGPCSVRMQGVR